MGQCPKSKCVFVKVLGTPHHGDNKITAANIVQQVAEVFVAERVIAEVLDNAAAVSIGVGLVEVVVRCSGKSLAQERLDLVRPSQIYNFFMREHRVTGHPLGSPHKEKQSQLKHLFEGDCHRSPRSSNESGGRFHPARLGRDMC